MPAGRSQQRSTRSEATPAYAGEIVGRVVSVAEGDTITVLDASSKQHKIRFNAIDAPERKQALGARSRQNLARYVAGKEVRLDCPKVDRYRRKV